MAKPPRASVGVALIAKNAAKTLGPCLDSIRPYVKQIVVGVDETTEDKTTKVAKKHGADVVVPIKVSDWHECEYHGRVLAQHFAQARNQSFAHLDPSLDFWMWLDSDDVLVGGEELAEMCAGVPEECCGVWLPYHYSTVGENRETNTLFDRERLLRPRLGWKWEYRVHEVVTPQTEGVRWIRSNAVKIYHQPNGHKTESSASRNLLLLEIDLEENPNDSRATFYMGNQYFAMGQWAQAVEWYERLCSGLGKNPYELWQAYVYLSMAYERLGDLDGALKAAYGAIDVRPEHPEPYFRLASVYLLSGEFDKVLYWTQEGRKRKAPPFFVFKNPLDYTYNSRMALADALAQMGQVVEARQELEAAYAVIQDERVGAAIEKYKAMEANAQIASSYVALAAPLDDAGKVALWEKLDLPPEVRQFGRCRDVAIPAMLRQRPNTQPRIVFWCGRAWEEWYPGTLNTTGIGGSETAVVEIAKNFAADGWRVDVYNGAGRYEGVYDEVGYWEPERLDQQGCDVYISWRQPGALNPMAAKLRAQVLWCHDLNYGPQERNTMLKWDKVLGVSQWHATMLQQYYELPADRVDFVPNGIDLARFNPDAKKVPFRCVYASSPDRGLLRLLKLWPAIQAFEKSAELHIAYGWDNIDKAIQRGDGYLAELKDTILRLLEKTPGVAWRGRLPQNELAALYDSAYCWLYPTDFLEVSCISAMEAMAGGCVPVCSAVGALRETVGNAGYVVPGNPYSRVWGEFYLHVARACLSELNTRKMAEVACRERAKLYSWDASYQKWKGIVEGLLVGNKELAGVA